MSIIISCCIPASLILGPESGWIYGFLPRWSGLVVCFTPMLRASGLQQVYIRRMNCWTVLYLLASLKSTRQLCVICILKTIKAGTFVCPLTEFDSCRRSNACLMVERSSLLMTAYHWPCGSKLVYIYIRCCIHIKNNPAILNPAILNRFGRLVVRALLSDTSVRSSLSGSLALRNQHFLVRLTWIGLYGNKVRSRSQIDQINQITQDFLYN